MQWFYFKRIGKKLLPMNPLAKYLPPRPSDANPDNGDILTPWYETEDHFDDEHVHVKENSLERALERAHALIEK